MEIWLVILFLSRKKFLAKQIFVLSNSMKLGPGSNTTGISRAVTLSPIFSDHTYWKSLVAFLSLFIIFKTDMALTIISLTFTGSYQCSVNTHSLSLRRGVWLFLPCSNYLLSEAHGHKRHQRRSTEMLSSSVVTAEDNKTYQDNNFQTLKTRLHLECVDSPTVICSEQK